MLLEYHTPSVAMILVLVEGVKGGVRLGNIGLAGFDGFVF